jgi:hypothetical protein
MLDESDEKDLEEALAKAYMIADHAEMRAGNAAPEMAAALRRSAGAMISNIEKALELVRAQNRRRPPAMRH